MKDRRAKPTSEGLIETVYMKEDQSKKNLTACDTGLNPVERIRIRSTPLDYSWFEVIKSVSKSFFPDE